MGQAQDGKDRPTVGFVGVGTMGRPMARRLLEAGYGVVVFDLNQEAVAELVSLGARAAASVKAVADEVRIVFTSMPTVAAFRQVGAGAGGVIEGGAVKIMVDLSTVGSTATQEVAATLLARGIEVVDAPISGGAAGAKAGTLAVMVAGEPAAVAEVLPLFAVFGKPFVVGEKPGQAQLMKLLNNMLSSTAFAVTAEAFVAGMRGGLDPETMMSVFNAGSGRNNATADKFPKYVLGRSFDFGFPISSVCKDIGLAVDECQKLGVPMWVGGQSRQLWQSAYLQNGAAMDMTALVRFVEQWSGPSGAKA
ncbi:NAD(P)-dependent oxidoreductase [Xylophilus sp. GOD-11R]|uniref:NAD(P)-dependent oxidoreductase n=1 Tax=Xylophilus sp. GOD-11R TaxID=3089814 RepID=UPI00298CC692|nr:NAD(P)-dependent oxidoreductase [Xylophilus sp. GOD-11R]WPB55509.1 NAD(P)-dependent oxidoreductase [Xylophilus sp. GOD-11R]